MFVILMTEVTYCLHDESFSVACVYVFRGTDVRRWEDYRLKINASTAKCCAVGSRPAVKSIIRCNEAELRTTERRDMSPPRARKMAVLMRRLLSVVGR